MVAAPARFVRGASPAMLVPAAIAAYSELDLQRAHLCHLNIVLVFAPDICSVVFDLVLERKPVGFGSLGKGQSWLAFVHGVHTSPGSIGGDWRGSNEASKQQERD